MHGSNAGGQPASAVLKLEAAGLPTARAEALLSAESGWMPLTATISIPPGVSAVTMRLFAKGAQAEFDDFNLSYSGDAPFSASPALLNPSYEQEEVGLRGALAKLLPQEAQWMAQVAANPQSFDKGHLWAYYAGEQFRSFWGNFGWVSVRLPDTWFNFWLVVSILSLLGLLWKLAGAEEPWGRRHWLRVVFLGSLAAAICVGFARQMMALALFGVGAFPQGRYLFVLSIALAWLGMSGLFAWSGLLGPVASRLSSRFAGERALPGASHWGVWVWANLMLWFAAYALGALVLPYYYG